MKKTFILFFALLASTLAITQTCVRDSSIYLSDTIVKPLPWTPDVPLINTLPACVGEPYAQSVTFNVPDSITAPGLPTIAINSISINLTGAIVGLPAGIGYSCDPPNCVFNKLTLGCLLLSGTPSAANIPPDTTELKITINVNTPAFPFPLPIEFPGTVAPNSKYYIVIKAPGQCLSGTVDPSGQIAFVKNAPNPFSDETTITVESTVSGKFQFQVFNMLGQGIYTENMNLVNGQNQFTFDAGDLSNGAYYFTIGNARGKVTRMMVISR